ncbi:MAG: HupE/UreJ family protein [Alphaproteobacteria bacterium]
MKHSLFAIVVVLVAGLASAAQAHTFGTHGAGFLAGIIHPFGGLDHAIAMVAVGIWAAQLGGRAHWLVPAAFVACMIAGGVAAFAGLHMDFTELGILGSVLVFGLLIAAAPRLPLWLPTTSVAVVAIFHGHAHGMEMPQATSPTAYAAGFVFATVSLHVLGIALALGVHKWVGAYAIRALGVAVAAGGIALAAA